MNELHNGVFEGERALYNQRNLTVYDSVFQNGESPLKEGKDIKVFNTTFKWKYPMWYSENVYVENSTLEETARSGIWYTNNITLKNTKIIAPKTFRRCNTVTIENCTLPNAQETFWNCENITIKDCVASGDYLGMNSKNINVENFTLNGNYFVDGGSNIHVKNAILNSKDAFWNCENVVVEGSTINGEYLGWNSKNVTFINCTIESDQGLCYMDNIKLVNCKLVKTDLSFELCSNIEATIDSTIDSVKNPLSGSIKCKGIGELIQDNMDYRGTVIDNSKTKITIEE